MASTRKSTRIRRKAKIAKLARNRSKKIRRKLAKTTRVLAAPPARAKKK